MPPVVAALYVQKNGIYFGREDVDPWDEGRDARKYRGPHPVVAHPPCQRWGAYAKGGPSAPGTAMLGDDGGCFAHALWVVRTFGGVIEHPAKSGAWAWFGITRPATQGWVRADAMGGWTCRVDQGCWGHPAVKATWLYMVGAPPSLSWARDRRRPNYVEPRERGRGRAPTPPGLPRSPA